MTSWYSISNSSSATSADVHLFNEIGFFGITADQFVNDLKPHDGKALNVHINSAGGEVFDGMAIYEALKNWKQPVTVYVDGIAGSIASIIAMGGDKIVMGDGALMMIHNASIVSWGSKEQLQKDAAILDKIDNSIAGIYTKRTGKRKETIKQMMADTTWLTADEAIAEGFADGKAKVTNVVALAYLDKLNIPKDKLQKFLNMTQPPKSKFQTIIDWFTGVTTDTATPADMKDKLDQFKASLETAQAELATVTEQLTAKAGELTALTTKLTAAEARIKELEKTPLGKPAADGGGVGAETTATSEAEVLRAHWAKTDGKK